MVDSFFDDIVEIYTIEGRMRIIRNGIGRLHLRYTEAGAG